MQSIGKFSLENQGAFDVKLQCVYWDENGNRILCAGTDSYPVGQSQSLAPCNANPPVPDGSNVALYADVVAGNDQIGSPMFIYQQNSPIEASYVITGSTLNNALKLTNVGVPPWNNWAQNIVHSFSGSDAYFFPTTLSQLQSIVKAAAAASGVTLRTSGQRHSQPPLVAADNRTATGTSPTTWLVDLSCYADLGPNGDQRMVLDVSQLEVTVNTGVREDELDAFLTANNLMLRTVTAGGFFSVGGMTAVDVHGATVDAPIFAETASAFTIMDPNGVVTTVDENSPVVGSWKPIQFARVSLGALGIVTSVTLDVMARPWATTLVPNRNSYTLDESQFVALFKTLLATPNLRVETFFNPYSSGYLTLTWEVDASPSKQTPNSSTAVPNACTLAGNDEFGAPNEGAIVEPIAEKAAILAQQSGFPAPARLLMDAAFNTVEKLFDTAATAYSDMWLTQAARVIFMSYFVELPAIDEAGLTRAWQGLDAVVSRLNSSTDFMLVGPMEFRFVQGGDSALAGTYTENANSTFVNFDLIAFVNATVASDYPNAVLSFFADIERAWIALGGMPHNGKMYGFYDPAGAAGSYTPPFNPAFLADLATRRGDGIKAFEAYRQERDPKSIFCNQFVAALLGHPAS
jgi:FAD/FMN-containing dehydrogenase